MITHHVNRFFDYAQYNGYSDEVLTFATVQLYNSDPLHYDARSPFGEFFIVLYDVLHKTAVSLSEYWYTNDQPGWALIVIPGHLTKLFLRAFSESRRCLARE